MYLIYIREAHPTDGWATPKNQQDGINIANPTTEQKRAEIAATCTLKLGLSWPTLVDSMDDSTNKSYAAWPDRFYVVGTDGKIALKGGQGPAGFKANELEAFLQKHFGR